MGGRGCPSPGEVGREGAGEGPGVRARAGALAFPDRSNDMPDTIPAYEKLGAFYLGRPYDPDRGETQPAPLLYDSRDLLTHAVCVGMTGSGKTGLLIGL